MLSAIIAAVAAKKKIRKSTLENEAKARCLDGGARSALVSEFNCLRCLDRVMSMRIVAESGHVAAAQRISGQYLCGKVNQEYGCCDAPFAIGRREIADRRSGLTAFNEPRPTPNQ
jgi:hypothetical protein